MKLKEIFDQLSYGELSQLSIGGGEMGVIDEANYPRILAHVNLALAALHKRFLLKKRKLVIELQSGRTEYPLTSDFAVSNRRSREEVKYIKDSLADPFVDDLFKVEEVWTDNDYEMSLNDAADTYSVMTPKYNLLYVPKDVVEINSNLSDSLKTATLEVVYRANHPKITQGIGAFDPERIEVDLPYTHLEPLLLFVASRVHTPVGMVNEFNAGNNYAAKYEKACQDLELQNLTIDQGAQSNRLEQNGWV